ncbi:MAG: site-2 protease family protein [Anaerosomatales bacterium]|nr:site-2 protease family protein [Anaerosomatales bacterium]
MQLPDWAFSVAAFVVLIPSVIFHEVAHGYAAFRLGDPTAKRAGRLSLNPLKHVDPFGTILLPALMSLGGGPVFGYAKPVPFNPHNLRDPRKGELIIGLVGPLTNFALAAVGGVIVRAVSYAPAGAVFDVVWYLGFLLAYVNLVLMFFNLLPIPPLDGSSVIVPFLSDEGLRTFRRIERQGFILLLALLWIPPMLGFDVLSWYFESTVMPLLGLLTGVS